MKVIGPYISSSCLSWNIPEPALSLPLGFSPCSGTALRPWACVYECSVMSDSVSMNCSLPGSSVHGIFQAIILEWVAISYSTGIWVSKKKKKKSSKAEGFVHPVPVLSLLKSPFLSFCSSGSFPRGVILKLFEPMISYILKNNEGLLKKFLVCGAWILSLSVNTVSGFIWNDRDTLFIFENMFARYPFWIIIVYISVVLSGKIVSMKKWLVQLATQTVAQSFSFRQPLNFST